MWPGEPPVSKQRLALRPARYPLPHLGWRKRADEAQRNPPLDDRAPARRPPRSTRGVDRTGRPHAEPAKLVSWISLKGSRTQNRFRPFPQVKAPMAAAVLAARRTERAAA